MIQKPRLTPELAVANPAEFTGNLIVGLPHYSEFGANLLDATMKAGNFDPIRKLTLNSTSFVSRSNAYERRIQLGTQPMPVAQKKNLIFNENQISYPEEITLRFLHELAHIYEAGLTQRKNMSMETLLEVSRMVRTTNQNLGLSAIGSVAFYDTQAKPKEDAAELLAMYAFDPDYFKEYIKFISDRSKEGLHRQLGLATVENETSGLYDMVEAVMNECKD